MSKQGDDHYPTVDLDFIDQLIRDSHQLAGVILVGSSTAYILAGSKPIHKRTIVVRPIAPNQVSYILASGLAIRFGKLNDLGRWLEKHRKWKDGAYVV